MLRQDDHGAANWPPIKHARYLGHVGQQNDQRLQETKGVQGIAIRLLVLPCPCLGQKEVWTDWLEHPICIHVRGVRHLPKAAEDFLGHNR